MREKDRISYVYIIANDWKVIYVGVTSEIEQRIQQHKEGHFENSFSTRYNLNKLVYLERFTNINTAIAREKQIKSWRRAKKLQLIVKENPTWKDLSAEWGQSIQPFNEEQFQQKRKSNPPKT